MPRHIYGEVDEREERSKAGCKFVAGCNTDSNKSGENERCELNINVAAHTYSQLLYGWAIRMAKDDMARSYSQQLAKLLALLL